MGGCEVDRCCFAVPLFANSVGPRRMRTRAVVSGKLLLAAFVIVPESLSSVANYFVISESCAIVVHERKFVWREDVGLWLSVEF